MKRINVLVLVLILVMGVSAQSPVLTFEKPLHDFGKIREQDGAATYNFKFTNTGNAPLVINRVHATCGCTTPNWTREPILPGRSGFVTASFNPAGRPGSFLNTISVFSNAGTNAITISIKGEVIPRPAVSLN